MIRPGLARTHYSLSGLPSQRSERAYELGFAALGAVCMSRPAQLTKIYLFGGPMRHLGQDGTSQVRTGSLEARRSGLDLCAWSEALYELPMGPVTEADFRAWLEGPLRRFFPFRQFFGAYGRLSGNRVQMHALITSGHGPEFVASRLCTFDLKMRGCFAWLIATRRAIFLDQNAAIDESGMRVFPTQRE